MKTFEQLLAISAAATVLAAKIVGRVIDQCARGFSEDEVLIEELCLYKAIQQKYPKDTVALPVMFKSMVRRAKTEIEEDLMVNLEGMSEAEKEMWTAGDVSDRQALLDAMPDITRIFTEAVPDASRWDNLPTIAQWSLLNSLESSLPGKIAQYKSWADQDRASNKVNTNAMRLQSEAEAAIAPVAKIVTTFLNNKKVKEDLAEAADNGTNVPPRLALAS